MGTLRSRGGDKWQSGSALWRDNVLRGIKGVRCGKSVISYWLVVLVCQSIVGSC